MPARSSGLLDGLVLLPPIALAMRGSKRNPTGGASLIRRIFAPDKLIPLLASKSGVSQLLWPPGWASAREADLGRCRRPTVFAPRQSCRHAVSSECYPSIRGIDVEPNPDLGDIYRQPLC